MEILRSYQRASHRAIAWLVVLCVLSIMLTAGCRPAKAFAAPAMSKAAAVFAYDSVRVTTPYTIPTQPDGIALDSAIMLIPCATQGCDGPGTFNVRRKSLSITPGSRTDVTNIPQPGVGTCFAGNITLTIWRKGTSKVATTALQYCRGTPPLTAAPTVGPAVADSIP